ncbi:DNA damage-inducible protein D [Candidatus Saccharibacteria bacterium]|nr:DNA damage-inducible protein D [Candidatus Saccharibacteria bacterium]MBR6122536.1 DNA damage-inducible protein D [Candidatus Saccharibacteria bacterium]
MQNLVIFDNIKRSNATGDDFWSARDLQKALGYDKWENFEKIVQKAKESFNNSPIKTNYDINYCFLEVRKPIVSGKGGTQYIKDYRLSRYACYLIAQNGDPRKEPIALAQSYFNIQTFRQELTDAQAKDLQRLERRKEFSESDKKLSADIIEAGVSPRGMAKIKASGNKIFFGGKSSKDMQKKLGTGSRPWADKLATLS